MESFKQLPLRRELQQSLNQMKFETPTEVQAAVIPKALELKDLMVCSQTE